LWRWIERGPELALAAEAAVMLLLARLLVARVPMRYWRGTLGVTTPGDGRPTPGPTGGHEVSPALWRIRLAVHRATRRLPVRLRCLPKAMALQWMARRRGLDCTLHIGLARDAAEPLHAWIDCGSVQVMGRTPDTTYQSLWSIRSC